MGEAPRGDLGEAPRDCGGVTRVYRESLPHSRAQQSRALTRALRSNQGVVTLPTLTALGFSKDQVHTLVRLGQLRRLHRCVYADARAPLSDSAHLTAALLSVGRGAWLAGRTAAAVWGIDRISLAQIEIGVVAASTPRRAGMIVHRSDQAPPEDEIRTRNGLRVSSVPRLLIEVSRRTGDPTELDALIERAVRENLLNLGAIEATLERHRRSHGMAALRRALHAYRPQPQRRSELERSFDRWLAQHPELPEPQRNIRIGPWEIDCYWPSQRLALELDGRSYHIAVRDFERDRRKDAWLQSRGERVLRISHERWHVDRAGAVHDLLAMLTLPPVRAA